MIFTLFKTVFMGGVTTDTLKKLILPLLLVIGIPLALFFLHNSYQTLKTENKNLTAEIVKLKGENEKLVGINKDNASQTTKLEESCKISLSQLKEVYDKRQEADKKELDNFKKRKKKEQKVDSLTVVDSNGVARALTPEERSDMLSIIRIDSLYEAYVNTDVGEDK